jgi:hypothetical protein
MSGDGATAAEARQKMLPSLRRRDTPATPPLLDTSQVQVVQWFNSLTGSQRYTQNQQLAPKLQKQLGVSYDVAFCAVVRFAEGGDGIILP